MHSKAHTHSHQSMLGSPANAAITILLMLLFLIFLFLLVTLTAPPAQAQNAVPPSARQAMTMPQFANGLRQTMRGQPRLIAAPSRASAALKSSSPISDKCSARRAAATASATCTGLRSARRSGAWRSASRATARQPRKRLTRSHTTFARCWISIAAGPSTRNTNVPGSGDSPASGRVHCILIGSL